MLQETDLRSREAKLKVWLESKLPQAKNLSISPLEKASAGFSNETYLFEAKWKERGEEKSRPMAIRWPPTGTPLFPDNDVLMQYRVMQCLGNSDLPVPRMYWCEEDESVLGVPFYVMGRIQGKSPADYPPGPHARGMLFEATLQRRRELWWRTVEAIAKIHTLDWQKLGLSFLGVPRDGREALERQIDKWERWLDWGASESLPVQRAGIDWLRKNIFEPSHMGLCWGDARPGNMLYRNDKVVAVLDWEFAHIGPPETDLMYFLLSDQSFVDMYGFPRLEGLPGWDETVAYYEGLVGRKIENAPYYKALTFLSIAVMAVLLGKAVAAAGGMEGFPSDFATNNWGTHKLAEFLGISQSRPG
ncbi:MAG: phosphotransferase family protein [Dehalococcoidia bacterium]